MDCDDTPGWCSDEVVAWWDAVWKCQKIPALDRDPDWCYAGPLLGMPTEEMQAVSPEKMAWLRQLVGE